MVKELRRILNIIEEFKINENWSIEILVPDSKDKFNYYYEPTSNLHQFDEVFVIFKDIKHQIKVIGQDMTDIIIGTFQGLLNKALDSKIALPSNIKSGELGYHYNIDMHQEEDEIIDYSSYSLWSTKGIQSWMYNKNDKIYLEIFPSYPWLFSEQEENNHITFEEFVKSYKPILVNEISRETAQRWLDKCNKILEKIAKKN